MNSPDSLVQITATPQYSRHSRASAAQLPRSVLAPRAEALPRTRKRLVYPGIRGHGRRIRRRGEDGSAELSSHQPGTSGLVALQDGFFTLNGKRNLAARLKMAGFAEPVRR